MNINSVVKKMSVTSFVSFNFRSHVEKMTNIFLENHNIDTFICRDISSSFLILSLLSRSRLIFEAIFIFLYDNNEVLS